MINFTQLVLASHNAGKLKELQAMLGESVHLRSIGEFSSVEPEETGLSFVENAILKARNAARISGLPALADDSGLAVDFLGGAPGIYSARYADGKGDAAFGLLCMARQFRLDFVPVTRERFDLVVTRRAYFEPPFQRLVAFCRTDACRHRAEELGGYALSGQFAVHFNAP